MHVVRTVADAVAAARALARPLGLVPTMGAIHAGHLALVERARSESAAVMATIFVNPLQFGPSEDFARYPRDFEHDRAQLEAAGADLLFAPSVEEMYPPGFATRIDPGPVAAHFEGALRPGHFAGVATVCVKLFAIARADRAYFGAKDAQQIAVLRRVVGDLALPVEFAIVPTVRESDGLAVSSRNAYLTAPERKAAPGLAGALDAMAAAVGRGERDPDRIAAAGRAELRPPLREAYLDVVDRDTFERAAPAPDRATLGIGSVWLGSTRLIDNVPLG